jgi:hypothetical protein
MMVGDGRLYAVGLVAPNSCMNTPVFAFGLSPTDAWWRMSGAKMRHPWRIYASVYREHKANSGALRPWRPPPDPIWHPPGLHELLELSSIWPFRPHDLRAVISKYWHGYCTLGARKR